MEIDRGNEWIIPTEGNCTADRGSQVDLKLADATVSRRHLTILNVEGTWQLADLESASGTFVNGEQVQICTLFPRELSVSL